MSGKRYIPLIDYLKAFAIILVTTTHFFTYKEKDFFLFIYVIQMGMPLFMLLTGYNTAMSNARHGRESLRALYAPSHLGRQFAAILPAYVLMFAVEAAASGAWQEGLALGDWLYAFVTGGLHGGSHGGYFFCIYWQYLLAAPLIYVLLRKYPRQTLLGALLLNMLYEYSVGALDITREVNRLLFMRYLFIAVFGNYFYLYRQKVRLWLVALAAVGSLCYLTAIEYFNFSWPLNLYWKNTCVYASFYYIAVMVFAFHFFENKKLPAPFHQATAAVGRATWHIYLTQMLFFRLDVRAVLSALPLAVQIICGVAACLLVGTAWNRLERRMRQHGNAKKLG